MFARQPRHEAEACSWAPSVRFLEIFYSVPGARISPFRTIAGPFLRLPACTPASAHWTLLDSARGPRRRVVRGWGVAAENVESLQAGHSGSISSAGVCFGYA